MCIGCEDFLEQKRQVFTKAALLLIPRHKISHEDHKDLVQSAYLRVLERKKIDPTIVSKPDNYLTTLVERLTSITFVEQLSQWTSMSLAMKFVSLGSKLVSSMKMR